MAYGGDRLYHGYFDGAQWHFEVVDNSPVGQNASIAIDSNGKSHISYQDGTNYDLKYATDASGAWVTETVDSAGSTGGYSSIALDSNNRVHISYLDWTNHYLKYATNTSGSWTASSLTGMGQYGFYTSLAVDSNDKVHISCQFKASGAYALLYVTNASGTWATSTVDSSVIQSVGDYNSIAVDSYDSAHISYSSGSDSGVYAVKYATNASGSWVRYMIDSYGVPVGMTSIAVDPLGKVHFSYVDAGGELRYATDASGAWSTMTLDGTVVNIWSTSMTVDAGNNIHVIYYDNESHDISYAVKDSGPWTSSTVDVSGKVGDNATSIALDSDNKVHIGYYDAAYNLLKYAANDSGSWISLVVDSGATYFTSIAVDSRDDVHMAYFTYLSNDLKYAANSPGGWVTSTIDSAGTVGQYTSIAVDSGDKAHISYFDGTNGDLKYATNSPGLWITSTADSTGFTGEYTSLALDADGKAHISYYDASNGDLRYVTNASGSWTASTIDSTGNVGEYTSLALDTDGKAHISYYDVTNGNLKYATNASGSWVLSTIDSTGNVGEYTSLTLDADGKAHISYYDASNGDLKYATNASGLWFTSTVDSAGDVGKGTSLALDPYGKVHISYSDFTNKALKYATNAFSVCTDNDDDGYGSPGDVSCPNGDATDCDDNDPYISPGATEVCNDIDDNCNGSTDEGVQSTYYQDADTDGYGDHLAYVQACAAPIGYVTDNTDCNDGDAAIQPGAVEIPNNSIDENCDGAYSVGGDISVDTTWTAANGTYIINDNITVLAGVTLTIEPGVTIKFGSGSQVTVYGTLSASGVTFTWADGANQWRGIWFEGAGANGSLIENCVIEHASGVYYNGWFYLYGILHITGSSPTISGCAIGSSDAAYGIWITDGSPVISGSAISGMTNAGIYVEGNSSPAVTGNVIASNTYGIYISNGSGGTYQGNTVSGNQYGIYALYSTVNPAVSGNTYSGNTIADLDVSGTINTPVAWNESGAAVYRTSGLTIAEGASLNISEGRTVKLGSGAVISVQGMLTANVVTFTWADEGSQWGTIEFNGAGTGGSRLQNCMIEHASGTYSNGWFYVYGILRVIDSSAVITGCTIGSSDAPYGIWISSGSPVISGSTISGMTNAGIYVEGNSSPAVTGNAIASNAYGIYISNSSGGTYQGNAISGNQYGIYALYSTVNPVISGNTYSGNTVADLDVSGTINTPVTWNESGVAVYRTSGLTISEGASLAIASGRTVKLNSGAQITVYGTLTVDVVTFTWADGINQWRGIWFEGSGANGSHIENCVIEHAAGIFDNGWFYVYGILRIINSSPGITGCTIVSSDAAYGIWISNGSPVISGNTISGMTDKGIYVEGTSLPAVNGNTIADSVYGIYISNGSGGTYQGNAISGNQYGIYALYSTVNPVISGNTYSGNTVADLDVSGTINTPVTWNESGVAVYRTSGLTISEGASLNISEGRTVKISGGAIIDVYGMLTANGATFTWQDGLNPWRGIRFEGAGASSSHLENSVIEHASGSFLFCSWDCYDFSRGVLYIVNSSPAITGVTMDNDPAENGIYVSGGSPEISNSTISGMTNSSLYAEAASMPSVSGNTLMNSGYGVYLSNDSGGAYHGNIIMDNTLYGFYYPGDGMVEASYNYWGDSSGPLDSSDDRATGGLYNPAGSGDTVSDHVNYSPWTLDDTDMDNDMIPDDGDNSGFRGDSTCTATNLTDCDDNCWLIPNADQTDTDNDGSGDACDACTDADGDGYSREGGICGTVDCSDTDPGIYPGGPAVRIVGATPVYFSTIQEAYNAAQSGETLQSKAVSFPENLIFGLNKSVVLIGGYDCGFTGNSGATIINGAVTVSSGKIIIQSGTLKVQ
jgi:parallel beta-helix repeat protein